MTGQIYLRKGGERINNMKSRMLAGRMFFAMLVPAVGYCAYPTIEEAQALFSSAQMNATNVWLTSQSYSDFRNRLCEPASYEDIWSGRGPRETIVKRAFARFGAGLYSVDLGG